MASDDLGNAVLTTEVSLKGLDQGISDAEARADSGFSHIGDIIGGALKVGLAAAAASVVAFGAVLKSGIDDARQAAQLTAQTEAVIKSTGAAAGRSAEQITDLASSLSAASGRSLVGDDAVQQAENLLLTFTNIKGEVFDAATAISVDMAQALGGEPKDQAIALGKALNDPIKGVTALTRAGVTFTDQQKHQIETMQKAGNVAGAQKIILAEINKEFGGSAEAAAKADGGWAQFNDRLGEAKEALGTAVLPLLNDLAGFLNDTVAPVIERAAAGFGDLIAAFQTGAEGGDFIGGLTNALYSLDSVSPVFDTIADGINTVAGLADDAFGDGGGIGVLLDDIREMTGIDLSPLVGQVESIIGAFTDAGPVSLEFAESIGQISPVLGGVLQVAAEVLPSLEALVSQVLGDIVGYFQANGAQMLGEALTTWQSISDTISTIASALGPVINAVLDQISVFWQAHGEEILAFVGSTWAEINSIIQVAMQLIQATVVPALQFLAQFIADHGAEIQAAFSGAWQIISSVIDAALTLIKGILTAALQAINGDWSGAWQTIQDMSARFVTDILGVINGGLQLIKASFDTTIDLILGIWNGLIGKSAGIGNDIVNGIINGIKNAGDKLFDTLRNLAANALQTAKDAILAHSPSQLFADEVGEAIPSGIAMGVLDNADAFYDTLGDVVSSGVDVMTDLPDQLSDVLRGSSTPRDARQFGNDILTALTQGVSEGSGDATDALQDFMGDMGSQFDRSDLPSQTEDLGHDLMNGLIDGMQSQIGDVRDTIDDIGSMIGDQFSDATDTHSPSQMTMDLGSDIMLGLLNGLEGMLPDVLAMTQQIAAVLSGGLNDLSGDARHAMEQLVNDLTSTIETLPDKIHGAIADAFDATADIDRQQARNIDAVRRLATDLQDQTQAALNQALAEAQQIQDPEQAAKFFKERSDQILELAKLQDQYNAAIKAGDFQHANDLQRQIGLIQSAQQAEQAAFGERSQLSNSGGLTGLADQLQQIINALGSANMDGGDLAQQLYQLLVQLNDASASTMPGGGAGAAPLTSPQFTQGFLGASGMSALALQASTTKGANITITVDARGASDPRAVEDAGYRGAKRALQEAGIDADVYTRTRR